MSLARQYFITQLIKSAIHVHKNFRISVTQRHPSPRLIDIEQDASVLEECAPTFFAIFGNNN
jgi:hypothetical protein